MSRRSNLYGLPTPNASLIHEIRMIAQHAFFNRGAGIPMTGESSKLLCVTCLKTRTLKRKAVTVSKGDALCKEHLA